MAWGLLGSFRKRAAGLGLVRAYWLAARRGYTPIQDMCAYETVPFVAKLTSVACSNRQLRKMATRGNLETRGPDKSPKVGLQFQI